MKELPKRILSGVAILAVTAAGVLINEYLYALFVTSVAVLATVEYYRMAVPGRFLKEKICIILAEAFVLLSKYPVFDVIEYAFLLSPLLVAVSLLLLIFDGAKKPVLDANLFFPLLYILIPLYSSIVLTYSQAGYYTPLRVAPIIAVAWIADIGAYCFGMAFGQRPNSKKLAPALSPHKSWAGVLGSIIFALLSTFLCWLIFKLPIHTEANDVEDLSLIAWMGLGLFIAVFGTLGDLFESLIKRHFGVKDSSHFIPGHGGILDRFDDLLFVFPASAIYYSFFVIL